MSVIDLDMQVVKIADIVKDDLAIYHDEGLRVYAIMSPALSRGEKIEISFVGTTRCSTQFLNASVGKLYLDFDPKQVDSLVSINYGEVNLLREKIAEVKDNAIHSKDYDQFVGNALA